MELSKTIYFDSASRSLPYKEVEDVFTRVSHEFFANPSSIHFEGVKANRQLEKAKESIIKDLKLSNRTVVFTSSATESNNLAIKGYALKYRNRGNHLVCSIYEHASVKEVMEQLKNDFGFKVSYVYPDKNGIISTEEVVKAITSETILVSIMSVNNEVGSINPINEIGKELKKFPKLKFHVDASQSIGKVTMDYSEVDMLTISSHKIHGLATGGCLVIRKNLELLPLFSGGGQENGLRSGTVDTASAVAFSTALSISTKEMQNHINIVKNLANRLYSYLESKPNDYHINSYRGNPYIVNFSTLHKKSSVVVEALSSMGIMVSSTSACSSYNQKGSYVVKSMFNDDNIANNTIRVSFSYLNTIEEVETLICALDKIIGEIR